MWVIMYFALLKSNNPKAIMDRAIDFGFAIHTRMPKKNNATKMMISVSPVKAKSRRLISHVCTRVSESTSLISQETHGRKEEMIATDNPTSHMKRGSVGMLSQNCPLASARP